MAYGSIIELRRSASFGLGKVQTKSFAKSGHRANADMKLLGYLLGRLTSIEEMGDIVDNIPRERSHDGGG